MRYILFIIAVAALMGAISGHAQDVLATEKPVKLTLKKALKSKAGYMSEEEKAPALAAFGLSTAELETTATYPIQFAKLPDFIERGRLEAAAKIDAGYATIYGSPYTLTIYDNAGTILISTDIGYALKQTDGKSAFGAEKVNKKVTQIIAKDGVLYFNFACPSYAKEFSGQCSEVYAFNLENGQPLWTSDYLASNTTLLILNGSLVTGYGFTAEPDFIYNLDKKTGKTIGKYKIGTGPDRLRVHNSEIIVEAYDGIYIFAFN